jgi:hypothetical protein
MNDQQSLFQNMIKRKLSQETGPIIFASIKLQLSRSICFHRLLLITIPEKKSTNNRRRSTDF